MLNTHHWKVIHDSSAGFTSQLTRFSICSVKQALPVIYWMQPVHIVLFGGRRCCCSFASSRNFTFLEQVLLEQSTRNHYHKHKETPFHIRRLKWLRVKEGLKSQDQPMTNSYCSNFKQPLHFQHKLTLRIFTTTRSLLVMFIASKTSLYFPRPSFRTSW